jgi:tellurite resistance protein TehA-like permease
MAGTIQAHLEQTVPLTMLILFGFLMALTVAVTVFLCRFRLARRHRVSYGTVLASVFIVTLSWFAFTFPFELSYNSHHDAQHMWDPNWLFSLIRLAGFIAVICLFPALLVVGCYQRRRSPGDK